MSMLDMTSLLTSVMESRLASQLYTNYDRQPYTGGSRTDSTRLAFDSQMRSDAAMYRQASQNMTDAQAMVEVAQSGTTAIKQHLNDMYKMATEASVLDMSDEQYASYSRTLAQQADLIVGLTDSISFNGMSLLNGTAGMDADGVVVLQGGNSQINQDFTNFVDADLTQVMGDNGNMNFNLLSTETAITDQTSAKDLADKLEQYIQRLESVESGYSYDIKGLENLSLLYEDRADVLNNTIQYQTEAEQNNPETTTSTNYLDNILTALDTSGFVLNQSS